MDWLTGESRSEPGAERDPDVASSFSIVIPSYSRPAQLADCLAALRRIDYPRDSVEVIVVDDGSSPPLDPVTEAFRPELNLTSVRQANAGAAAARNAGAARATGEFLAFTDDDCLPEPGWLRELAQVLTAAPECMVGGATLNGAGENLCSATSQLIVDVVYRYYNANPNQARFLASNNLALSAKEFREIGGFNPAFRAAEDRELCDRWLHRGRRIIYHPAARVRHAHILGVRSFCRQHFHYGRGAERYHWLRAARGSGSMLSDSRFHLDLRNWFWYPLTLVPRRRIAPVAALLGLWQLANLAGFLCEAVLRNASTLRDSAFSFSR
jgi:GT2 family glycosyltransferase